AHLVRRRPRAWLRCRRMHGIDDRRDLVAAAIALLRIGGEVGVESEDALDWGAAQHRSVDRRFPQVAQALAKRSRARPERRVMYRGAEENAADRLATRAEAEGERESRKVDREKMPRLRARRPQ